MKQINKKVTWEGANLLTNGFTLVELLAVIVILAIIALITTPIIMNVIENTKEASYDRSVEGVLHSANILAMDMKVTEDLELDKNIYDKIVNQISGDRPEEGQVYVNKKGEIALSLRYGDYCYTKSYGEKSYYREKTEEDCITPFYYLQKVLPGHNNSEAYFLPCVDCDVNSDFFIVRKEIEQVVIVTTNLVPEGVIYSWDVGVDQNNNPIKDKIKLWYKDEDDNGLYEVYIGQEGGVKANVYSNYMFSNMPNLKKLNLNGFDTSAVKYMNFMFNGNKLLTELDLSNFDTSNVINMEQMFSGCNKLLSIDLSSFNTNNVTNMKSMFGSCSGLRELNIKNFNTINVTTMDTMFRYCSNLKELDLRNFSTSNVIDMTSMFEGAGLLEISVSDDWVTAKNNANMFLNCGTNHVTVK